jgi:hypothetical protein
MADQSRRFLQILLIYPAICIHRTADMTMSLTT